MQSFDIPLIDISPLFGPAGPERDKADAAIIAAASSSGFMTVTGLEGIADIGSGRRRELLKLFTLPEDEIRKLYRQKFEPKNSNVYRGWFPKNDTTVTCKEGIDMGPDIAYGADRVSTDDPLREATPLPSEALLPGWRAVAAAYYRDLEKVAACLMQSLARGLHIPETTFDAAFIGGISTLRLLHYPLRDAADLAHITDHDIWVDHNGQRAYVTGRAHCDSGFLTLLAQDGVSGLQAKSHDGVWVDVPPREGNLAINFGRLLERWTGGTIKATEHRVIGTGRERYSVPFFYEARVDAEIAPLPIAGSEPFEPFYFGDHLWSSIVKFVEFHGMEEMRKPLRASAA
jgi:isopenicillin N synthase-like dioxygenase